MLPDLIELDRIVLRPWSLDDVGDVFGYAADEEWGRYLPIAYPYCETAAREFVAGQMALDRRAHVAWAIELEGRAVGGVDLRMFQANRIAEVDYGVARACWGRGLATEAVTGVLESAFRGVSSLLKIRSMIDARNAASGRVLEKVGMKREGVLRANGFARGELIDEAWYGMLRAEWEAM